MICDLLFYLIIRRTGSVDKQPSRLGHVEPAAKFVGSLSLEMGEPVRVSPQLSETLVYVAKNGLPAPVVLKAVAKALHASISRDREGLLLERTPLDRQAFLESRTTKRQSWIERRLDGVEKFRKPLLSVSPEIGIAEILDRAVTVSRAVSHGARLSPEPFFPTELLPGEKLLTGLIKKIGIHSLAAVPIGAVMVWEDQPVVGALPLPEHRDELAEYDLEIADLRGKEELKSVRTKAADLGMAPFYADLEPVATTPSKLRIQVRPEETMSVITMAGFDESGKQEVLATLIALPGKVWEPPGAIVRNMLANPRSHWADLSKEAADAPEIRFDPTSPPNWFLFPNLHEPLDGCVGEGLDALAAVDPHKCFVAQVTDSTWDDARFSIVGGRLNIEAFEAMLYQWSQFSREEEKDCIVLRPDQQIETRECQASRTALHDLADVVLKTKTIDLQAILKLHASMGKSESNLANHWVDALRRLPGVKSFSGGTTHLFYKMLSEIPSRVRERGANSTIAALGLRDSYRDVIWEDRIPTLGNGKVPDLFGHGIELYPDGKLESSTLDIAVRRNSLTGVLSSRGDQTILWQNGTPVLTTIQVFDSNEGTKWSMSRAKFDQIAKEFSFQFGTQDEISVEVGLPLGYFQKVAFMDPIKTTSKVLNYSDLSTDAKDALWKQACDSAIHHHH